MADKIDGLKLGFENLIIKLVIPSIKLGAISVKAGRTLYRVVPDHHRTRRRLSHPQPFTHAKTTIVSQHGYHLHPPWPSFLTTKGETHVGKHKKQEKKTRRTTLPLTVKKTIKTTFFCSLKWGLSRTRKTPKTKITPFPKHIFNIFFVFKHIFSVFCFQKQKTTTKQAPIFMFSV